MTGLAAVVLAHSDARHVSRLIGALDGIPIFLHLDAKVPAVTAADIAHLPRRVTVLPGMDVRLYSWSLVAAELMGLRMALARTPADHIAVLSGSDYPLVSVEELLGALRPWQGHSYLYNRPLPFSAWNTARAQDGGRWRTDYRFLTRRNNIVSVRGLPIRWPVRRAPFPGLELRASAEWKIYSREHAGILVRLLDDRPDLIRFWRSSFTPDESFAASVLASPAIVGRSATPLRPCLANAWYYRFPPGESHPRLLTSADFDDIATARRARPLRPESAFGCDGGHRPEHQKLFARKFSSRSDPQLLERIDATLRR